MISFQATVAIGGALLVYAGVQVWREARNDKRQAAGLCYSCGNALGEDWKQVRLPRKNERDKKVSYCASCSRGRNIWHGLMALVTSALFIYILLVCFYWKR